MLTAFVTFCCSSAQLLNKELLVHELQDMAALQAWLMFIFQTTQLELERMDMITKGHDNLLVLLVYK